MKAYRIGRLLLTLVNQAQGAPVVDRCRAFTPDGLAFDGRAIHLTPWRKNSYGDRLGGLALVIGWRV